MDSLFFLPKFPLNLDTVGWAAIALLAAVVCGEFAIRAFRLPRITGHVVLGTLLGQAASHVWATDLLPLLRPLFEFAFGLLLFELGTRNFTTKKPAACSAAAPYWPSFYAKR